MERIKGHIKEAYQFAMKNSTDTSTQVGAKLVDKTGALVTWGANRLPRGVIVTPERLARPAKYSWTVHAEVEAITEAAKQGIKTEGSTLYGNWAACDRCAGTIIDAGIIRVVSHKKTMDACPEHWMEPIKIATEMFKEAGVVYEQWEGNIGKNVEILFNGLPFRP